MVLPHLWLIPPLLHGIFCSSTNQQPDRQFSHLSPPPFLPRTPCDQVISTVTYLLFIDKSLSILLYTRQMESVVYSNTSWTWGRPVYNSYCARRRISRMDDIVRKSSLTSRVFIHELLLRLLRFSSNLFPLITMYI